MSNAERIAKEFHAAYEDLAPMFSYETREASRTEWEHVPENNRLLMISVVQSLLSAEIIALPLREPGQAAPEPDNGD